MLGRFWPEIAHWADSIGLVKYRIFPLVGISTDGNDVITPTRTFGCSVRLGDSFVIVYTCMFRNSQQHLRSTNSRRADRLHPYGKIIISTIQSHRWDTRPDDEQRSHSHSLRIRRCIVFTACRYNAPNLTSRNYYEILGVERKATQKEIKKAFFKLSKQVKRW